MKYKIAVSEKHRRSPGKAAKVNANINLMTEKPLNKSLKTSGRSSSGTKSSAHKI